MLAETSFAVHNIIDSLDAIHGPHRGCPDGCVCRAQGRAGLHCSLDADCGGMPYEDCAAHAYANRLRYATRPTGHTPCSECRRLISHRAGHVCAA